MDIGSMIADLGAHDPEQRQAAADRLVAAGAPAVEPLVAALHGPVDGRTPGYVAVLQRIGEPAFAPLVAALARYDAPRGYEGAPSRAVAIGRALLGLRIRGRDGFVPLLRDENRCLRSWACVAIGAAGADAARHLPALLPLLADEDPNVRWSACRAVGALTDASSPHLPALLALLADPADPVRAEARTVLSACGPSLTPVLRELRRTPGRHRRYALAALAETVGWDGLDGADQALLRRLMRTRIAHEVPEPFEPDGQWYAIPTDDQAAVLDALDLSDPVPVTMRYGAAAAAGQYPMGGAVAYVTPVLDGWTLAFTADVQLDRTAELSRRFGLAHAYLSWDDVHGCGDATGWCIAERGDVVRCYLHQADYLEEIGAPHPAERGRVLPHEDDGADDEVCTAADIAAELSVDPAALGPHTRVAGQPVLALTEDGRQHGVERGALPTWLGPGRP
jgi:HEAT repeat protein